MHAQMPQRGTGVVGDERGVREYKGEKPRGRDVKRRKRKGSVGTSVRGEKMSVIVERIK